MGRTAVSQSYMRTNISGVNIITGRRYILQRYFHSSRCVYGSNTAAQMSIPATAPVEKLHPEEHPLVDTFDRYHNYLRISVTERCNLRCTYCMPEEGVELTPQEQLLTLEEQKQLVTIFASLGVTKLRITGGEPTVYKGLLELVRHAASIPTITTIGITTNGMKLKTALPELVKAGLNSINISIDTLDPEKFERLSRRDRKGLALLQGNIIKAMQFPTLKVKLNCVVTRGTNDDDIVPLLRWVNKVNQNYYDNHRNECQEVARRTLDMRFIELMPFDSNNWKQDKCMSYMEIIELAGQAQPPIMLKKGKQKHVIAVEGRPDCVEVVAEPTDRNDTTKWFHQTPVPTNGGMAVDTLEHTGNVGFITSMSSHFCSTCNRLRVTANGELKICLFDGDGTETNTNSVSLLSLLRSGRTVEEVTQYISQTVKMKKQALGGLMDHSNNNEGLAQRKNRPMILIGG